MVDHLALSGFLTCKVTFETDLYGTKITQYYVDAVARPQWGVGSLITFQFFDEGILERGAETIRAAIDLRKAAVIAASTPMPSAECYGITEQT